MARRFQRPQRLRCPHVAALWEKYHETQRTGWAWQGNPEDRPVAHEPAADGYCADCYRALYTPGAVWPPEVWAYLDAEAAAQCAGSRRPTLFAARKLPAAPKARCEPPVKHRARLQKAYTDTNEDGVCARVIGRPTGDGYRMVATNGHCALLERGQGKGDVLAYAVWQPGKAWIDLPPAFHLALSRVATLAYERSHPVRCTVDGTDLVLHAKGELGNATERVALVARADDVPTEPVCLDAEYLDPVCGVWPLRWYLRGPVDPQVFEPRGADYRVVIMPMRD